VSRWFIPCATRLARETDGCSLLPEYRATTEFLVGRPRQLSA
jgi:hypothetical protein